MVFSIFTELCNQHYYLSLEHFITSQRSAVPINSHPLIHHTSHPWQPLIYFLWICLF